METAGWLAFAFIGAGVVDIVLAFVLANKLPPAGRILLTSGGVALIVLGALFAGRVIRI
jgi:uncharacterized membrane protein HdeD (DUF308 family)